MVSNFQPIPLSHLIDVNPSTSKPSIEADALVSFIPMQDVSENGQWVSKQVKKLKEIKSGYTSFQEGDILFAKITPCMENGKGCHAIDLVNGIGFGTTEFHVLRAKSNTEARFIFHWTQSKALRLKAETFMTGSAGQQRVAADFFHRYLIPYIPQPEQQKIAEIIDAIDKAIALTDTHITKLKKAKAGLLHDLLTRGIDEHGELRDYTRNPELFKRSALGIIPKDWDVSSVSFEFDIISGFTLGEHRRPLNKKRKYLRVANVKRENIILDDIAELEANDDEFITRQLKENDLLIVEGHADPNEIGRCAIVSDGAVGLTFQNHLFRLRYKVINPKFALFWLNSAWVRSYWKCLCGTSSGLNTINQTMLNALLVLVPKNQEQIDIVERIETYKERIIKKETYLNKLKLLKKGLMSDLLTGRVRVKI